MKSSSDEIRIYIDRKGELIISGGGNHRHGIAKLLKIETVPVIIKGIHYLWLRKHYIKHNKNIEKALIKSISIVGEFNEEFRFEHYFK